LNVQRFRGGLVFKAHRLCAALNSRLESNKEEKEGSTLDTKIMPASSYNTCSCFRISGFSEGLPNLKPWLKVYQASRLTKLGVHRTHNHTKSAMKGVRAVPIGTVLNLRTTTSQKCAAVLRRARI